MDVGRVLGAGNDHIACLNVPAQNNLHVALAVLCCKAGEQRLFQQALVSVAQRIPCLNHHAILGEEGFQFFLPGVGVNFGLEDGGLDFADAQNFFDLLLVEVG